MFARCDQVFADEVRDRLMRTVSETITDQVWVTTSELLRLLPIPEADRIKLAHGNADRLLGLA